MFSLEIIEALEKHINRKLECSYSRSYGAKYEENKSFELGVRSSLFVLQELVKKLKELYCQKHILYFTDESKADVITEYNRILLATDEDVEMIEKMRCFIFKNKEFLNQWQDKNEELGCREQNLQYLQAQLDAMYSEAPELQGTEYHKELIEQIEEADREVNRLSVEVYLKANQEH